MGECSVVLAGQQRGGDDHCHLDAGHGGDERGAQGDFGFAEADVAADKAVHRFAAGEVFEDVGDGAGLVLGFGEGEARAKFVPGAFAGG